jgi:sugar lactone lactonase YvrE
VRTVLGGLAFPESPRWHDEKLWFCNWGTQEVLAVEPGGSAEVMARVPTTLPYSIDWLPDGRMLIVSGQEAALLRQEPDGSLVLHADLREFGAVFNEIVVDERGTAFVNGTNIVAVSYDGAARQVADGLEFGNGMALTPDGRTLVVAESHAQRLSAFDVGADGALTNRRIWAECDGGSPDGICLDDTGAVWYADVPNRRCVRVREGGLVLDVVEVDRGCFACMLGGPDGRTLFVLAATWRGMDKMFTDERTGQVLAVPAPAPRAGRP